MKKKTVPIRKGTKNTSVNVEGEIHAALRRLAKRNGMTMSEYIRAGFHEQIDQEKQYERKFVRKRK